MCSINTGRKGDTEKRKKKEGKENENEKTFVWNLAYY